MTVVIRDPVVRGGLELLLAGLQVVGTLTVGEELPEDDPGARRPPGGVVILSAADRGWTGVLRQVLDRGPDKVLVLLAEPEVPVGLDGTPVDGFLLQQETDAVALTAALSQVVVGGMPLPAPLARQLLAQAAAVPPRRPRLLTTREQQALELLADGLSNKQIGRRLNISEHGAKRLVTSLLIKLDAPNRTRAVAMALQEGLLGGL
ncbi:response regulator transcription factor [Actinacidiphila yeochonensis]|uniref:response regulator transcription factor n=1 Tax=Actinacidiphila yeochonensis TaxID=89050 RepID=UPI00068EAE7E|nr:response regulator transcription factor [Actinacidiphila yeochonensis]